MLTELFGIIMKFFYDLFNNYGIAIILFTIFFRIIMLPLAILVQKNSIKLISIKSKINQIKIDNYGDDLKIAELESALYKKEKYNPFISVIPLIIQIIVLICLVTIINNPITYITDVSKETRDELISNIDSEYEELEVVKEVKKGDIENEEIKNLDLSFFNYDLSSISVDIHNYLFPFLAALTTLIYYLFDIKWNVLLKEQSRAYNLITLSISVLISLYLGLFVPIGVTLYWIFTNFFLIIQLFLLNIIINPKNYIDYKELERSNNELKKLTYEKRTKNLIKKEKEDYKKFFAIDNKHLVIYAENKGYYRYFKGIIEYLLNNSNLIIHYITSDYYDDVFNMDNPNFKAYYIGEKKLISLMMKLDCDVVLMTTPDLNNYYIKRSYVRKDIEYIFLPHGIGNHIVFGREGSLDHFDTIFALDKYQKEEIEVGNKIYNLNRKVVELGYPLLDDMIREYKPKDNNTIVIAPSWQKDNIMDLCVNDLVDILSKNYKVVLRPHPQYLKHNKNKISFLKQHYKNNTNVIIQEDYTDINNIFGSGILITDWSGIAYEYAYASLKPVIFINTPMKVLNKNYKDLNIDIFELYARDIIGKTIDLDKLNNIDKIVNDFIKNKDKYSNKIDDFYKKNVYNIGSSGEIGAKYIVKSINEKISRRKYD